MVHTASKPAREAQHCEIIDSLLTPMQGKENKCRLNTSLFQNVLIWSPLNLRCSNAIAWLSCDNDYLGFTMN